MGIISSKVLKTVNYEHKSQKNQVLSEKQGDSWRYQLPGFMKGGGCKETYVALQDCVEEAENNNESVDKCYPMVAMLAKCMEAHSDYYQPLLEIEKAGEELLAKEFYGLFSDQPIKAGAEEVDDDVERRYTAFMEGGGCKESFTAWCDCKEEADKNKEDYQIKCATVFGMVSKCMDAHSDYYQPIIAAKKTTEELMVKEHQAFFSEAS